MRMILLGPPGAGKGTQAKILAKKLNLAHISTGDLLRQNVAAGTELGRQANDYMHKGLLVPDELVSEMVGNRLKERDTEKGWLFDGYPRNLKQAESLDALLERGKIDLDCVIDLDASEPVIIQRLSGRLACGNCGANFHIKNMPPRKPEICDNCGGRLYQRPDDKEETVKKRLEVYKKETAALIEYYRKQNKLQRVSADLEPDIVVDKILRLLKKK